MTKLIIIIAIGIGVWQWYNGELPFMSSVNAFDESGQPIVQLITMDDCGNPCALARKELDRRRVDYSEILIDPNNQSGETVDLWAKVGNNVFPLIVSGHEKINGSGTGPEVASLLALNYGDEFLSSTEKRYFKKHFYPDGSPKIVMYGASWCPFCRVLRDELKADDVDYIEIDVEKSGEHKRMSRVMGVNGYPTTWVGYKKVNGGTLRAINKVRDSY